MITGVLMVDLHSASAFINKKSDTKMVADFLI